MSNICRNHTEAVKIIGICSVCRESVSVTGVAAFGFRRKAEKETRFKYWIERYVRGLFITRNVTRLIINFQKKIILVAVFLALRFLMTN